MVTGRYFLKNRDAEKGFTLIELLVVIAITGIIIGAFAYPSYRKYLIRAHRSDATQALLIAWSAQERYFSLYGKYGSSTEAIGENPDSGNGLYTLKIINGKWNGSDCESAVSDSTKTRQFTAMAIPVAGKSQADDADCGCLYINNLGLKFSTGTNTDRCWR